MRKHDKKIIHNEKLEAKVSRKAKCLSQEKTVFTDLI